MGADRLAEICVKAQPNQSFLMLLAGERSDRQHRHPTGLLPAPDVVEQNLAATARNLHVEQDQLWPHCFDLPASLIHRHCLEDLMSSMGEQITEQAPAERVVFDEENSRRHGRASGGSVRSQLSIRSSALLPLAGYQRTSIRAGLIFPTVQIRALRLVLSRVAESSSTPYATSARSFSPASPRNAPCLSPSFTPP